MTVLSRDRSSRRTKRIILLVALAAGAAALWWMVRERSQEEARLRAEAHAQAEAAPVSAGDQRRWREALALALSRLPAAAGYIRFPDALGGSRHVLLSAVRVACDPQDAHIGLEWGGICEDCASGDLALIGRSPLAVGFDRGAAAGLPVEPPKLDRATPTSRHCRPMVEDLCGEVARRLGAVVDH